MMMVKNSTSPTDGQIVPLIFENNTIRGIIAFMTLVIQSSVIREGKRASHH